MVVGLDASPFTMARVGQEAAGWVLRLLNQNHSPGSDMFSCASKLKLKYCIEQQHFVCLLWTEREESSASW